jgi:hypothetical protein
MPRPSGASETYSGVRLTYLHLVWGYVFLTGFAAAVLTRESYGIWGSVAHLTSTRAVFHLCLLAGFAPLSTRATGRLEYELS